MPVNKPGRQPKSNRFVASNGTPPILQENLPSVPSKLKGVRKNGAVNADSGLSWYDDFIAKSVNNPLYHIENAYPWGQADSRHLRRKTGLEPWQKETAVLIGEHQSKTDKILRLAIAAGNNVGKTAFLSWIILHFLSTNPFCRILVAASSGTNLHTRLWVEVDKWLQMSPMATVFEWQHSKLSHRQYPTQWFAVPQTWSHERPDAFSGIHEEKVLIVFDEASAFPPVMWETAESCLTSPGAMWLAFGNPHEPRGPFRDCFDGGVNASVWQTRYVDARQVSWTDKEKLQSDIDRYGLDSDYTRIHILGKFPKHGEKQLIAENLLDDACNRTCGNLSQYPIVIGVDVAASIDGDSSVILVRQGPKILEIQTYKEDDEVVFTGYLQEAINKYDKPHVFIDAIGYGHTVGNLLKSRGCDRIELVKGSYKPNDASQYHNKRAEMFLDVRNWIKDFACLDAKENKELIAELSLIRYLIDLDGRWQIESKDDMKNRGYASPDQADALSVTFAARVSRLIPAYPVWTRQKSPFTLPSKGAWMR